MYGWLCSKGGTLSSQSPSRESPDAAQYELFEPLCTPGLLSISRTAAFKHASTDACAPC